jgi:predicted RNA-binding protein with PIN domain
MTRPSVSPLDGVDRLLVDGTNLLHTLARGARTPDAAGAAPLPAAALIGRLRAAIPPAVAIELVFDGAPEPGMRGARIASGVLVRYGGRRSADELIVALVDEARAATADARGADNILVVTDDRDLRAAIRARGAGTAGAAWLVGRLGRTRLEAPTTGNRRPPGVVEREGRTSVESSRPGWRPGRGATTKRGNPKRSPRGGRLRED